MLNLNKFAEEVHANSVRHGWWDGDRDFAEICALIHSEWSEALEEARANRDMVWTGENGKPEGIAVELIDGVIRILDWIGKERIEIIIHEWNGKEYIEIFQPTINSIMKVLSEDRKDELSKKTVSQVVARLHCYTSNAYSEDDNKDRGGYLIAAMQTVFSWLDSKGVDVENVLVTKHEFNKLRPYKHGKKF